MGKIRKLLDGFWKKAVRLIAIGVLLSFFLLRSGASSRAVFLTDTLFWIGMSFFVCGLVSLVHNIGAFNGLIYGTKSGFAVFKGKQKSSREMIDGYVDFCNGRRRFTDMPQLMVSALVFFALSICSRVL